MISADICLIPSSLPRRRVQRIILGLCDISTLLVSALQGSICCTCYPSRLREFHNSQLYHLGNTLQRFICAKTDFQQKKTDGQDICPAVSICIFSSGREKRYVSGCQPDGLLHADRARNPLARNIKSGSVVHRCP